MASNVIEVIIKANDQLTTGLDRATQSVSKFNASSILAFAGVTASIGGLIAMYKRISDAGAVAEQADVKLATAMKRVGQYSQENFRALSEQATALARVSWADDEAIKRAQTLLISFGVQTSQLQGLTRATLDFAAATGVDLNTAALQVGRAILTSGESMGRYNLGLTAAAGSAERVAEMQKRLNELFGGTAAADISIYTGKIHEMREAFDELMEGPGQRMNARMGVIADGIKRVALAEQDFETAHPGLPKWLERIALLGSPATYWLGLIDAKVKQLSVDATVGWRDAGAGMTAALVAASGGTGAAGGGTGGSAAALGYMPQTWVVKGRSSPRDTGQELSKALIDAGNAGRTMGAQLEAAFNANMARAQQFASVISGGIANSLVSATVAGDKFFKVLGQGLARTAVQIIEMIIQMRIMKSLMASSTFMGWFGLPAMLMAGGGKIPGAYNGILVGGTPGRDSILIAGQEGEEVVNKPTVALVRQLTGLIKQGGMGNQIHIHLGPAIDTEGLRHALRYGALGRELARAGGF